MYKCSYSTNLPDPATVLNTERHDHGRNERRQPRPCPSADNAAVCDAAKRARGEDGSSWPAGCCGSRCCCCGGACSSGCAMLTLTTQSPEVVQRVAQAELEFATYQAREGVFSRPTTYSSTPRLWSLLNGGACMAATSPSFARLHHACSHSRALRPLRSATGASTAKSSRPTSLACSTALPTSLSTATRVAPLAE